MKIEVESDDLNFVLTQLILVIKQYDAQFLLSDVKFYDNILKNRNSVKEHDCFKLVQLCTSTLNDIAKFALKNVNEISSARKELQDVVYRFQRDFKLLAN